MIGSIFNLRSLIIRDKKDVLGHGLDRVWEGTKWKQGIKQEMSEFQAPFTVMVTSILSD